MGFAKGLSAEGMLLSLTDRWKMELDKGLTVGAIFVDFRESSFNMTRGGDEDIEGGLRKFVDTRRGGSEKIVALGGGAPKICILQNQHMTSSYRSDGFQLNNLMTCATQLYHVVYRYIKCSLSNYYTLVHPKNALANFKN